MGLVRAGQLGMKIEANEGVEESLTAAEFAGNRKAGDGNPFSSYDIGQYERGLRLASLSQYENIPGDRIINHKWAEELVGGGAAADAPWHAPLRASGFSRTQFKVVTVTNVTGGFRTGDVFGNNASQGSATATGRFVYQQTIGGNIKFVYVPLTGTLDDTMALTNYGRTGGADVDANPANAGYQFRFLSETDSAAPPSLTIEERVGGQRLTGIGARGIVSLSIKRNEPALFNFEFKGAPVFDTNGKTPRTGSLLTGITQHTVKPSIARGMVLNFYSGSTTYAPVLTQAEIKSGNTLAPRPTVGQSLASSGFLGMRISDRKPTMNIDPEHVASATWDWVGLLVAGDTMHAEARIGNAQDANGLIVVSAPKLQLTGNLQFANRDGIQTVPNDAMLAGAGDDELEINHIFLS